MTQDDVIAPRRWEPIETAPENVEGRESMDGVTGGAGDYCAADKKTMGDGVTMPNDKPVPNAPEARRRTDADKMPCHYSRTGWSWKSKFLKGACSCHPCAPPKEERNAKR